MFSLTVLTMILAIIRAEIGLRGARDDDTWFFICTTLELTIGKHDQSTAAYYIDNPSSTSSAIIIACLVSYRSLFTGRSRTRHLDTIVVRTPTYSGTINPGPLYTESTVIKLNRDGSKHSLVSHGRDDVMELNTVHMRNDY